MEKKKKTIEVDPWWKSKRTGAGIASVFVLAGLIARSFGVEIDPEMQQQGTQIFTDAVMAIGGAVAAVLAFWSKLVETFKK